MKIIAHRGYWIKPEEKNTKEAFLRAIEYGYGIETDIRDDRGQIVIAHDMPTGNEMTLTEFLSFNPDKKGLLAINIKSDGLVLELIKLLKSNSVENYFTFDMSQAESRRYIKNNLNCLISISEYNNLTSVHSYSGIWLDAFESEWYSFDSIFSLLDNTKDATLSVVSPELHGRPYTQLWNNLKNFADKNDFLNVSICTDFPKEADNFFNGVKK